MNDHTEVELRGDVAALKLALEAERKERATEVALLRARIEGLQKLPGMNETRANRLLPLYALLATRTRAVEEKIFPAEDAAATHAYWVQALRELGINPDPLNLERNE